MSSAAVGARVPPAVSFDAPDDLEAINRLYREKRWSDGLPIVPPTETRVARMLGADDAFDVFGVHGVGGIVGAILTGVFAAPGLGGTQPRRIRG